MEVLIGMYIIIILICIGILIWFQTKSGQKWLDDL